MSGWWLDAACRGKPTSWWYPERGDVFSGQVARNICSSCPVQAECLEAAIDEELVVAGDPCGIRGGRTAEQRVVMLRKKSQVRRVSPEGSRRRVVVADW